MIASNAEASETTVSEFIAGHGDPTTWTPANYETYGNLTLTQHPAPSTAAPEQPAAA